MKIAMIMGTSAGGTGRHVASLVRDLCTAGHDVTIDAPPAELAEFDLASGPGSQALAVSDRPHPQRDLRAMAQLRGRARTAQVVHAHGARVGALAVLAAAGTGTPVVVTLHNAAPGGVASGAVHRVLERIIARGAHTVLGVSDDIVERQRSLGARGAELAVVAAPPIATANRSRPEVRGELGVAEADVLLLAVGRLAPQKNFGLLLDAIADLSRECAGRVRLVVAGEGPQRSDLEQRIARDALPVTLLGQRRDLADLFLACDVVVSSASWEGQPVALQEALQAGAAIVATDAGGTRSVVGDCGILVPTDDRTALANAIAPLLDPVQGSERITQLRRRARERAASLPTEADARSAALAAYERVLAPDLP